MITRRMLMIALGASALGCIVWLVPPKKPNSEKRTRVCLFYATSQGENQHDKAFVDKMRELGWVEDDNVIYDRVYANDEETQLASSAAALVSRGPHLIFAPITNTALAALAGTRAIPIVFSNASDPVGAGLVKSLAHPGGNVTGIANIGLELGDKRLQLLKETVPMITRVGVLVHPLSVSSTQEQKLIERAAVTLHVTVIPVTAKGAQELDSAFALLTRSKVQALLITQNSRFYNEHKRILELAARQRIPVVGPRSEFADDGALISYSSNLLDQVRRTAQLADKILKGTKPADIPVEQPTKFELVINMKTAKAYGITLPQSVMLQADRVIE